MKRSFLLLQGPCSPFFAKLATALSSAGHAVQRVLFCAGDLAYRGSCASISFRHEPDALPEFLADCYQRHGITDQLVFGDCRPVHRPAITLARNSDVRNHVFEEGYFRPWWITLEREGVNRNSLLPRDPDWFRQVAKYFSQPASVEKFSAPFSSRVAHDVMYHLAGALNPWLFPGYRNHAPVNAATEYAGYVRRFTRLCWLRRHDQQQVQSLLVSRKPYFLLPLQLDGDSQIRHHSRYAGMGEVIDEVMESFAAHASADAVLVIKNHPLDPGLTNIADVIRHAEHRTGIAGRVWFLEGGDLQMLVSQASGLVTVNSTVGMVSLQLGCPTFALADSVYHLPGLTSEQTLDDFWCKPAAPDPTLFECFHRVLMNLTQINGGFYSRAGIDRAVAGCVPVLTTDRTTLEQPG